MAVAFNEEAFVREIDNYGEKPRVLVEGDSWFGTKHKINLTWQIDKFCDFSLLNLSSEGDDANDVLPSNQKKTLRNLLQDRDYNFKLLLFSGGGIDIVGDELEHLLIKKPANGCWQDCINHDRLERKLQQIKYAYLDLIDIRNDSNPDCVIVTHGYDYFIPSSSGVKILGLWHLGPWILPTLEKKAIHDSTDQKEIVKFLLQKFNKILMELESPKFICVQTLETLHMSEWGDEIHPTNQGFKKLARERFRPNLQSLFPQHVF